jgi:hypothetical protein
MVVDVVFRMIAYPPEGPYERWELTVEETGEVLLRGAFPYDRDVVDEACDAYCERATRGFGAV